MKKSEFVVIDHEGNISWDVKKEAGEKFKTFKAAEKRAKELAESAPGQRIATYKLTAETIASISKPDTKRV